MKVQQRQAVIQRSRGVLTCLFSVSVPIWPCRQDTSLFCVLCDTKRTTSIRLSICMCTQDPKCYKIQNKQKRPTVSRAEWRNLVSLCNDSFMFLGHTRTFFLFNNPGESYKSKHRSCTSAHPSLNFPSCSRYWKMMEDVDAVCLVLFCSVQCYKRQHWQLDGRTCRYCK